MGVRELFVDSFMKGMNAWHKGLHTMTGGRFGGDVMGMPVVELHTTGRTSGKRRSAMLTAPVYEPDRVVLVASKGGDDRDPEWYRNLVADPHVELTVEGTTRPMLARTANAREKAALWPTIVEAYHGYADYQRRTTREIPVVILTPR